MTWRAKNRSRKAFRLQGLPTKVQKSLVDGKRAGESCHVFTQNVKAGGGVILIPREMVTVLLLLSLLSDGMAALVRHGEREGEREGEVEGGEEEAAAEAEAEAEAEEQKQTQKKAKEKEKNM